jgi:iron complex transport system ATP-binding protein
VLRLEAAAAPWGLTHPTDLAIVPGEFVAVIGPNGAGKTTTLKLMAGLLAANAGRVTITGQPVESMTAAQRATQIALVPQREETPVGFTVREVVALGRYARLHWLRGPGAEDLAMIEKSMAMARVDALSERSIESLSAGERQRVTIARALSQQANLLLLDEPVANLDPGHASTILELLRRHVEASNSSVVCALHDVNQAARYATRVLVIDEGRILADGKPETILTAAMLSKLYDTIIHRVEHPDVDGPQFIAGSPQMGREDLR